jgi:hypothetical protein
MTTRTSQTAKDRDRIDWLLRNPPHYDADSVRDLLGCCLSPLPGDRVTVLSFRVVDGQVEERSSQLNRSDAMVERLTSALNVFLIERTLESEPSMGDTHRRLRVITDAADHLKRVLGMSTDALGLQLPWPIARRFMHVMGNSAERTSPLLNSVDRSTDTASHYLAQAQMSQASLSDAMSSLTLLHQLALAASRSERSQMIRRRKQPDVALGRLVQAMSAIWTDVLGQELRIATNNGRNVGRWAPIPDSYQHFISFVRAGMKPIGVNVSADELRAAIAGEGRRRPAQKRAAAADSGLATVP